MIEKGNNVMKREIKKYLEEEGKRLDSRKPFDYRDVEVTLDVSKNAEGSVSVKLGKTEVVAGIKMNVGEPYPDHEKEGTMMTTVEMLPLSSGDFDYGPPTIDAIETARVIDRGIRESGFIDFEGLCIKEGEKVWNLFIDIATINNDGNLLDAGALAALIALRIAKMPVYDEKEERVKYGEFTDKGIPLILDKMPITITMRKIGNKLLVDPLREEEQATEGRLSIEMSNPKSSKEPMINAMQKGGDIALSIQEIEEAVNEASKIFKNLSDVIEDNVKKSQKNKK